MTTTALTTKAPAAITTTDTLAEQIAEWNAKKYHVLCPSTNLAGLPQGYALVATAVAINPDVNGGEVYQNRLYCGANEVAIAKVGLRKIADCAGMSVATSRVDPPPYEPFYWMFKARSEQIGIDGRKRVREATCEWDLRDGSPRLKGFKPAQIEEARKHGARNAETRAVNAVIRELGVRQKYTKAELTQPFIAVQTVFQPDMTDPEVRRMAAAQHFGAVEALYAGSGSTIREPLALEPGVVTAADVDVPMEGELPPDAAPDDDNHHVSAVLKASAGGYILTTKELGDRRLYTDSHDIALAAKTAMDAGTVVEIVWETRDGQDRIVDFTRGIA